MSQAVIDAIVESVGKQKFGAKPPHKPKEQRGKDRARKRRAKEPVGIVRVNQFTTLDVARLPAGLSV
jgi:hypothetical protein